MLASYSLPLITTPCMYLGYYPSCNQSKIKFWNLGSHGHQSNSNFLSGQLLPCIILVVFLSFGNSSCIFMYLCVIQKQKVVCYLPNFLTHISIFKFCIESHKLCTSICYHTLTKRKFCVRFGIFNPAIVYDHLGEIFSALVFGSLVFCIFLYIKVSLVKNIFVSFISYYVSFR